MKHIPQPSETPDFFALTMGATVGVYVLFVSCSACRHTAEINLARLAERIGEGTPTGKIKARLRCSACGSRRVILTTLPANAQQVYEYRVRIARD